MGHHFLHGCDKIGCPRNLLFTCLTLCLHFEKCFKTITLKQHFLNAEKLKENPILNVYTVNPLLLNLRTALKFKNQYSRIGLQLLNFSVQELPGVLVKHADARLLPRECLIQ